MIKFVSAIFILTVLTTPAFAETPADEELRALDRKINQSAKKCSNTTGVKNEDLKTLFMGETPLERKIGCFLDCVAKDLDLYKDKNMFDQDKVNKFLEPIIMKMKDEKIPDDIIVKGRKAIEDCLTTQQGGDDACAVTNTNVECMITKAKKAGLLE